MDEFLEKYHKELGFTVFWSFPTVSVIFLYGCYVGWNIPNIAISI